jgi:hypothetical protein
MDWNEIKERVEKNGNVCTFAAILRERYAPSTRKTHRTVLRSWLRWLVEHGHLAEDFSGRA